METALSGARLSWYSTLDAVPSIRQAIGQILTALVSALVTYVSHIRLPGQHSCLNRKYGPI